MKIKYLAIALFSTTLLSSPLLAKDKVKPVKIVKEMDKASPANMSIQTSTDELEVAKKKAENKLHKEASTQGSNPLHKSVEGMSSETEVVENQSADATKAREKGSGMATGRRTYEPVNTTSATGYLKIDDIKGETSKAADEVKPDRIEFKKAIAAPDVDGGSNGNRAVTATDYNSSRSNKADGIAAPDTNNDNDGTDDASDSKATDYNSSRSNKSLSSALNSDGETDTDVECDTEKEKKVCEVTETHTICSCTHL